MARLRCVAGLLAGAAQMRCDQCKHSRDFRDGAGLVCYYGPFSQQCRKQRESRSPCGEEGRLFEPKENAHVELSQAE